MSNAFRLPDHIVALSYDLLIRPDLETGTFSGSARILVRLQKATSEISLHALGLTLENAVLRRFDTVSDTGDSTTLFGTITVDKNRQTQTIVVNGSLGAGEWEIQTEFAGNLNDQLSGFYRTSWTDPHGTEHVIAATHFEPTHARLAFPCFDEPQCKARFKITLEIDEHLTAISNSDIEDERQFKSDTGRKKRVSFRETEPLPSYLVAFIVGPFEVISEASANGKTLRIWSTPGKAGLGEFALSQATSALRFYESYFGIEYPGDKIDHVAIPDFPIGAMENMGCITFREDALLIDEDTASHESLSRVAEIVMHELAHMWFGNLVTMRWWNGLWLKESFATFMANLCLDATHPHWNIWESFSISRAQALSTDSLASTHPIECPVENPDQATEMFDIISYEKGCAVLYQLHEFLGAEVFAEGCSRYLKKHSWGTAQTSDLWLCLESACTARGINTPVREIMDSWIFSEGHPLIQVKSISNGLTELSQQRSQLASSASAVSQRARSETPDPHAIWPVPLIVRSYRKNGEEVHSKLLLTCRRQLFYTGEGTDQVLVNAGASGFYRVAYEPDDLKRLTADLDSMSASEQFNLLNDAWFAFKSGQLQADDMLDQVTRFGPARSPSIWKLIDGTFRHLMRIAPDEQCRSGLRRAVIDLAGAALGKYGYDATAEDSIEIRETRAVLINLLGTLARSPDAMEFSRNSYEQWKRDNTSLDSETTPAVVQVLATTGTEEIYEDFSSRINMSTTPQEKTMFLLSLALFQEPSLVEKTLSLCLSDTVRKQDSPHIMARMLARNESGRERAWQHLRENIEEISSRFPRIALARMLDNLASLDRPEQEKEISDFFKQTRLEGCDRAVNQMLEKLRANAQVRQEQAPVLARCFSRVSL